MQFDKGIHGNYMGKSLKGKVIFLNLYFKILITRI